MQSFTHNEQKYRQQLKMVFGEMSDEQINQIFANTQILDFEAGTHLFKQGDTENALYIVLSGRLRAFHQNESGTEILGDIAAGEPVGELALFTKEPRTASVVALRRSVLLQLKESDYLQVVDQFPVFAHSLTNFVIQRLRRNAFQQRMGAAPKNIAVVKLQPNLDLSPWTIATRQQLGTMNVEVQVYYPNALEQTDEHAFFEELENHAGLNFLVCDDDHPAWANQCMTYCDLILIITDFNAPTAICPVEAHLHLYEKNLLNKKNYLVLLHPADAPFPTETRRWFRDRNIDLHLHIRQNHISDIRRFSRIITHRAVGLVLGGGGAKGLAHVGAVQAMMEAGIEFDFVGGTSAGALMGVGMTRHDFHFDRILALVQQESENNPTSKDYHFPFISMMTGRKMRKAIQNISGDAFLEDFWVTTYTISTNYSTASLAVHKIGSACTSVEASVAIPGVFPPVIIGKHLHVDGGVMDNLPIEVMYQYPVNQVIAIALTAQAEHLVEIAKVPSAMEIFINKITKKKRFRLPGMSAIIINSLTLNSVQKQSVTKSQVAMYLEMDLRKYGLFDWLKWKALLDEGYQQTQAYLKNMPEGERFWK